MKENIKKFGIVLWLAAFFTYVGGFAALSYGRDFLGIGWQVWFWNSLLLGVLAIGVKLGVLIEE
ncbi:MAG: hypothetical protein A3C80_01065 [Candidatus Ryanbacteria bacterium RIFCSPHIGHO2_02_FULL_45_43]|uniref:Uncharacterized protein n=1 Tax=Candidatus Ryanbacteria bacterium RIFCSPHIGHO2_01_45_13 TaxID=1802112 RepID=A0A1G2FYG0_9BACT|nr:MAG: hypothetical protein A2718_03295 [Candidatus Ryanbacteria bacterium RIFCSPHIGHO2_01_FULL_44_130]OGZ42887.1 MAG: hypothetical protein A2W41_02080 [Candidatus Ryanbacteria bacterium RIFCSPHIGHO2_01_45_13]OGZ48119.1 MAG: hypothetical protein A3C80_01065 [Candidatus Ryanbacteria bacterium RIFCSPHIGHO2_02_FULL_45_43]OGZ49767.1 MAG: hypothetical protein A3E55_00890 [Candidatus Ryanbacteria bacterium RIFCSPHIGHO2_12_FULL_44_20]OGZ51193.1 MAG: hypothetical protein A3A17_04100 [Candidatus Ryanba